MGNLRILVVSDIHMFDGEPSTSSPSWVSSRPRYQGATDNPLSGLVELLKGTLNEGKKIDWLLCPGDLADKHGQTVQGVAWSQLLEIRQKLQIRHLFGTVGNHDVDSRRIDGDALPADSIKSLSPNFPHGNAVNQTFHDQFWSNGIAKFYDKTRKSNLVVLNSSIYHGVEAAHVEEGNLKEDEWKRGKVRADSIEKLRCIARKAKGQRNILMLHHHISPTTALVSDSSVLANGSEIVDALTNSGKDWLVVHGHLHIPNLKTQASSSKLTVLSSGSAGGKTWQAANARTPDNQVHLIEFSADDVHKAKVYSWNWVQKMGWQLSKSVDHGLPHKCGFGGSFDRNAVVQHVSERLEQKPELSWQQLSETFPDINFTTPAEQTALFELLESNNYEINLNRLDGSPTAIRKAQQ